MSSAASRAAVLLACLAVAPASASGITFDFDTLPDSAGCSQPVATGDLAAAYSYCDPDWVAALEGGIVYSHEHTVDGLTLLLEAQEQNGIDWDTAALAPDGAIFCGNTPDCTPYIATFSQAVSFVSIDVLGAVNRCGCGGDDLVLTGFYLEVYDGEGATGTLLGQLSLDPGSNPTPVTLALSATGIRSALFGVSTADHGECSTGGCENLGIIDDLVVVPEPATAGLLAAGVSALGWAGRRRTGRAARRRRG